MTAALLVLLAGCTEGGKEVEDTDVFETVPVNLFVVDRVNQCVRYAAVPMPAVWWEGWPEEHGCRSPQSSFLGEIWSGECVFMPNHCWTLRMERAETFLGDGTGINSGCQVSGNEPCDCRPVPYGLPFCGTDTPFIGSRCWDRTWPESDCGLTAEPL